MGLSAKKAALSFLVGGSPLALLALLWESEGLLWGFTSLTMGFPIALIVVGISSKGGLSSLGPYLGALAVTLQASGLGMLFFSRYADATDTWMFGLPPGAVFMLLGLWLMPLAIVSWAYPATFSRVVLDRCDLERIRRYRSDQR